MIAEYLKNFDHADFSFSQDFSSLKSFFQNRIQNRYNHQTILEAGCGRGELSLWLRELGSEVTGIDRVNSALPQVPFIQHDLLTPLNGHGKFDLIIDSHLFHCLVFNEERELYLKNMKENLNPHGIMMIECLGRLRGPNPLSYLIQEDGVVWVKTERPLLGRISVGAHSFVPFRRMNTVQDLERLSHHCGFQIKELIYENSLNFTYTNDQEENSFDLIRLILTIK